MHAIINIHAGNIYNSVRQRIDLAEAEEIDCKSLATAPVMLCLASACKLSSSSMPF